MNFDFVWPLFFCDVAALDLVGCIMHLGFDLWHPLPLRVVAIFFEGGGSEWGIFAPMISVPKVKSSHA